MTAPADSGLATVLVILGGLGLLIGIAVYVWYAIALSRLFPRIDGEGWKGWVPVLNEAEILARGGVPAWSVVFYFIPLVQLYGLYLKIVATHRINKRFGRGAGMTVLAILLPPVWATVLAWGAAPYPEGDRLAALQPGPRRSAPPAAAPARDASGYTIPSLAPSGNGSADAPALVFPDYAPPSRPVGTEAAAVVPTGQPAPAPTPAPSAWGAPPPPQQQFVSPPPVADPPARSFAPPPVQSPAPQPVVSQPVAVQPPAPQPSVAFEQAAPIAQPDSAPLPSAPEEAHPPTGIMAAMGGVSAEPHVSQPAAPEAQPAASEAPVSVPEVQTPQPTAPPLFIEVPSAHPSTSVFEPVPRPVPPTGVEPVAPEASAPEASAPEAPVEPPQRVVRSVPPSFRAEGTPEAEPQAPTIRPAPDVSVAPSLVAPSPAAEPVASMLAPEQPITPVASVAPAAPAAPFAPAAPSAPAAPFVPVAPPVALPPAAAPGGLNPEVDETVVTPRPTDDDLDATVVVARKRGVRRVLVLDDGRRFSLSGASVVIGRNPVGDPGEQRLAISDTTRTLSKTHARLVVQEDEWRLTDLHATNGVVVVADDGAEMLLDPGESVIGTGRFILGEVGMHVVAERDS
ncbi:FHA domain-containing protein [Microbacterium maritypicum]|uniref:DUF5684 domain-containing protein n=1 Tax=Microbacterium maritypicum TaxID=33918 RepID=UPI001B333382|nr:DUF5684 domain-containing protein [Microbacterium liquefaciens]MBP5803024.1 FHA domain-containing protein [Microbacterium liquefaciens]